MRHFGWVCVGMVALAGVAEAQSLNKADAAAKFDSASKQKLTLMADGGLEKVMKLRPVTFDYRNSATTLPQRSGLLASDVAKVFPEYVTVVRGPVVSGTALQGPPPVQVDYARLTVPLIKAVQELKADNDALRAEFEAYRKAHP